MSRVHGRGYREAIGFTLDRIPAPIAARVAHVQFVCGIDPVFAGLHHYEAASYGRSYRNTAHCLYPWHIARPAAERVATVVLPVLVTPTVIVHELGHALHEALGFDPKPAPVTWYARTDDHEAFAEAFTAWMCPGYGDPIDDRTRWLFDALAEGREAPVSA